MIKGENVRIMVGGQVVGMAKEAKFSIAEDDVSTKEFPEPWRTPDIKQSWDITGNVMVRDAGDVMRDLLNGKEKKNVTIQRKPPRLPRKMKKAYRSDYPRNTKWTRKVVNMIRRQSQTFHDCEVVVTPDQIRLVEGYHRRLAYSDGHKPLALSDVKDAYMCGAEEMERLIDSSMWWKSADGGELPAIDREVIALTTEGKVVFAHRPKESWQGKNIDTGEVTTYYPERYGAGQWNAPDIKWWLDIDIPMRGE